MPAADLTDADKQWLEDGGPFPPTIVLENSHGRRQFNVEERDNSGRVLSAAGRMGRKGFVLFVRDQETNASYAAKLCLLADYGGDEALVRELRHAAKLASAGELFAAPSFAGKVSRFEGQPDPSTHWACFIVPRVEGRTVRHWLEHQPDKVTPELVGNLAKDLVGASLFLQSKGLKHDDLHAGNLMLRPSDPDLFRGRSDRPEFRLTIIDTGSLKPIDQDTTKPHDDWGRVAKVLAQLHNAVFQNRVLASRYPRFLTALKTYCQQLLDGDKARWFPTEESYYRPIDQMLLELRFPAALSAPKFEPFDAISAEHLANDKLLLDLFVQALPWIDTVRTVRPTVLTGPRGCGKSMLMRYLGARVGSPH